jgi:hypothetical protein
VEALGVDDGGALPRACRAEYDAYAGSTHGGGWSGGQPVEIAGAAIRVLAENARGDGHRWGMATDGDRASLASPITPWAAFRSCAENRGVSGAASNARVAPQFSFLVLHQLAASSSISIIVRLRR